MNNYFKKYGPEDLSDFSLREIKFGRARIGLLNAFLRALEKTPYEEIRIRDLCREAEVSEPAFYNYFPRKDDLFLYFISLWSVDVQLHTRAVESGLAAIREIFAYTARSIRGEGQNLMKEIIAYQARTDVAERIHHFTVVTLAEKSLAFGVVHGLDAFPDQGLEPILQKNLAAAVSKKQIPKNADIEAIGLILGSLFFGLPTLLLHEAPDLLEPALQKTLNFVFQIITQKNLQR